MRANMSGKNLFNEITNRNRMHQDDLFEYDHSMYKVALEKYNFEHVYGNHKCSACDGIGYFYLSDHRLIQCERCNGKG